MRTNPLRSHPKSTARYLFRFVLIWLALTLYFCSRWARADFNNPTFDQILFTTTYSAAGLMKTDPAILKKGILWCLCYPLFAAICLMAFEFGVSKLCNKVGNMSFRGAEFVCRVRKIPFLTFAWTLGIFISTAVMASNNVGFGTYCSSFFGPDYFAANYIAPKDVAIRPRSPKNLLMIYIESLTPNYRRKDLFGRDLLAPLQPAISRGHSFSRYEQVTETGWTMGAEVSTQCGIPLHSFFSSVNANEMTSNIRDFLPSARCLGDILLDFGYANVFLQGASLQFAGQGKFWKQHGYQTVFGDDELVALGDSKGPWGVHDDSLLVRAGTLLGTLQKGSQPFNLTVVLLDTHHPKGLISPECSRRGAVGLDDIISCTAAMLQDFLDKAESQGLLRNTQVVLVGDHLPMATPLTKKLSQSGPLEIFNLFLGKTEVRPNRDLIVHFDLFPTILEFIGFEVPGGRLGLGYSGFGDQQHNLKPELRLVELNKNVNNRSPKYVALWLP